MAGGGSKKAQRPDFFVESASPRGGGLSFRNFGVSEGTNDFRVRVDPSRGREVRGIAGAFGQRADQLGLLRSRVAPGLSRLRQARLDQIDDANRAATGNLRDNLQRRRILGSSFGADSLARTDAEFSRLRDQVEAETELQEIELTKQFINEETAARAAEFQTFLDELNVPLQIATQLSSGAPAAFTRSAELAQANSQFGINTGLGLAGTAFGLANRAGLFGGLFGGAGAAAAAPAAALGLFSAGPVTGIGSGLAQSIGGALGF